MNFQAQRIAAGPVCGICLSYSSNAWEVADLPVNSRLSWEMADSGQRSGRFWRAELQGYAVEPELLEGDEGSELGFLERAARALNFAAEPENVSGRSDCN